MQDFLSKRNNVIIYFYYLCPRNQSFHILAPLAPFLQDWGLSFPPETFSHKFFPKFFPIRPRRLFSGFLVRKIMFSWGELFSTFLVRKIMGVKGFFRSPNGGGVPFCRLSLYINRHSLTKGTPRVLQHSERSKGHRNRSKRGQK